MNTFSLLWAGDTQDSGEAHEEAAVAEAAAEHKLPLSLEQRPVCCPCAPYSWHKFANS